MSALGRLIFEVPVEPDAEEARTWVRDELGKVVYQEAKPTWFDRLASALWDWLTSLRIEDVGGGGPLGLLLIGALVVGLVVAAFVIFGAPARRRRSRVTGELFGQDDGRDSSAMRRDAERFAGQGEWAAGIADMFRAIARGLAERTIVATSPGATAQRFAEQAGAAFPGSAGDLRACADLFDEVRYLGNAGTRESFDRVAGLERTLREASPRFAAPSTARGGTE